jgi:hypothetical protein
MNPRGRLVPAVRSAAVCCDRCPAAVTVDTSHFARRRLLKAAVFQSPDRPASDLADQHVYHSVTGTITDISPHFVTIGHAGSERRFALTADASAWRGETLEPSALSPGDEAVIRIRPGQSSIADRIWANIGRVCGTIIESDEQRLVVSEGAMRRPKTVVISPLASVRVRVKTPSLRPGYLIDIIGLWHRDELHGLIATSPQPPYRSDHIPPGSTPGGLLPEAITGSAVWHDSGEEPYGVLGAFYPAVDPAAGCAEDSAARIGPGSAPSFRELPYLAIGSALRVRNECTGIAWTMPVTGCTPVARMFNDHCVTCKTSPRGRVVDLTVSSFIALGGELEQGCFNATLTIGR